MSARDVLLNDRALQGVAAGINRGVFAASTRARWAGATQFGGDLSTSITIQDLAGAPTWTTVLSLTLDPGRWLLIGATTIERSATGGNAQWRSGFRIDAGVSSAEALAANDSLDAGTRRAPLNAHIPILSATEWTVSADVYQRNEDGGPGTPAGTASALDTYLIAYPL